MRDKAAVQRDLFIRICEETHHLERDVDALSARC